MNVYSFVSRWNRFELLIDVSIGYLQNRERGIEERGTGNGESLK